jgi:hypothetical protein
MDTHSSQLKQKHKLMAYYGISNIQKQDTQKEAPGLCWTQDTRKMSHAEYIHRMTQEELIIKTEIKTVTP